MCHQSVGKCTHWNEGKKLSHSIVQCKHKKVTNCFANVLYWERGNIVCRFIYCFLPIHADSSTLLWVNRTFVIIISSHLSNTAYVLWANSNRVWLLLLFIFLHKYFKIAYPFAAHFIVLMMSLYLIDSKIEFFFFYHNRCKECTHCTVYMFQCHELLSFIL